MKKVISIISGIVLSCSLVLFPNNTSASVSFKDVPTTHWAYQSINSLVEKGYISGISSTEFGVNTEMNRGEVASALYKLLKDEGKLTNTSTMNPFDDISYNEYKQEIIIVSNNGYLSGKGNSKFDPDGNLTRAEMAVVISKVFDLQLPNLYVLMIDSDGMVGESNR